MDTKDSAHAMHTNKIIISEVFADIDDVGSSLGIYIALGSDFFWTGIIGRTKCGKLFQLKMMKENYHLGHLSHQLVFIPVFNHHRPFSIPAIFPIE